MKRLAKHSIACLGLALAIPACKESRPAPNALAGSREVAPPVAGGASAAAPSTAPGAAAGSAAAATVAPNPVPGAVGSELGAVVFEAAAPDASWVVMCRAAHDSDGNGRIEVSIGPEGEIAGDRLERVLVFASGRAETIDDLLAAAPDGRHLVVRSGARVELVDATGEKRVDLARLGADVRRDPAARYRHRTLVFDADALFYVRAEAGRSELVERRLASGAERVLYAGAEPIVRIAADALGHFVVLRVAGADVNGNGRFDWPFTPVSEPKACRGPAPRFPAARFGADALGALLVPRGLGPVVRADDLAIVFGDGSVRRAPDGALSLERGGRRAPIADKACQGRVLFADPLRDQLLVGCAMPKKTARFAVERVRAGVRAPLGVHVAALAFDEPARKPERLLPIYPGADAMLFDAERGALLALRPGDLVLAVFGSRALVRRGKGSLLLDVASGSETDLMAELDPLGEVLTQGRLVYAPPLVVDLGEGRVLGAITGRGLALASSGAVLVPRVPPSAAALAQGPLTWTAPR